VFAGRVSECSELHGDLAGVSTKYRLERTLAYLLDQRSSSAAQKQLNPGNCRTYVRASFWDRESYADTLAFHRDRGPRRQALDRDTRLCVIVSVGVIGQVDLVGQVDRPSCAQMRAV